MANDDTVTGGTRSAWAAAGSLVIAVAWVVLAGRSPDTTYHVAPALVAWTYPYLRLSGTRAGRRQALGAVVVGTTVAVITTVALDAVGWLEGPVLVGADALEESLLVAGFAAVVAAVIAGVPARGGE